MSGRPTVKVERSRTSGMQGSTLVFIEGPAGQRIRIFAGGGDDVMNVFIEHDWVTHVEVTAIEEGKVRWHDDPTT